MPKVTTAPGHTASSHTGSTHTGSTHTGSTGDGYTADRYRRNWRALAACRCAEPELFFPAASAGAADLSNAQAERAKAVCHTCPVRRECLQFALATRQSYGIWGGMSERERRVAQATPA